MCPLPDLIGGADVWDHPGITQISFTVENWRSCRAAPKKRLSADYADYTDFFESRELGYA
jgi:hypothetical protein